ncbi:MAG TPA: class I SAM-dependent methyltransferase [Solirubrobacteraceae bacterium]|nr:class I SAM-dependent methyltransferase [Solirubrobacteraceae bacterium]HUA49324.1 class I SAM-dependent methyltransferase [Solirubrobacteraceae bacterium]
MPSESDNDEVRDAGGPGVHVSALEHPMVVAALARMAASGAWQRVIDERPLSEAIDIADAELLVAAGALTRVSDETFRLSLKEATYRHPQAVAHSGLYVLRRALAHASGRTLGWGTEDPETVLAFGRVTGQGGDVIADQLLPQLPAVESAFRAGSAAFLDVGVGVAAISIRLVARYPGTRAVGLDVLPDVLELAESEVAGSGLSDSIELRLQSVADLRDQDRFDLAWVPQGFIPKEAFLVGIPHVFNALKPGGALLVPVALHPETPEFARARLIHSAFLAGGSTITPSQLVELLQATGFNDLAEHPVGAQVLMTATKRVHRRG